MHGDRRSGAVMRGRTQRLLALGLAAGALAFGLVLHRFWLRELSHLTGDAEWIWVTDVLERVYPVAGLFVAPVHLDAPAASALLKVCGDREYVVYVNGSPAACGWSRPGYRLDLYDVAHLLRQGDNVVAVEVRSPTPAGGLLLALDVEGVGRDVLVSGSAFVYRSRFGLGPPAPGDAPVPLVWGAPPHFPWGYPRPQSYPWTLDGVVVEEPMRYEREAARTLAEGGLELKLPQPVFGYLWLEFEEDGLAYVATFPDRDGADIGALRRVAQPAARIPEQRRWLDPEPRLIGSVYVFGRHLPRAIELWPVAEEFRSGAPGVVPGQHGLVPRTRWTTRTPPG